MNIYDTVTTEPIIKKVIVFGIFVLPGFLANFLLYFLSSRIVNTADFGIYYLSITIGNILFSASPIFGLISTQYLLSEKKQPDNSNIVKVKISLLNSLTWKYGSIISLAVYIALSCIAYNLNLNSYLLLFLVVSEIFISYLCELGRTYYQVTLKTVEMAMYTSAWLMLRLMLGIVMMYVYQTPSSGILGQLFASLIVYLWFRYKYIKNISFNGLDNRTHLKKNEILYSIFMYGCVILICNLDIVTGYLILSPYEFGLYSASSIIPKGAIVLIASFLQMLIPYIINKNSYSKFIPIKIYSALLLIAFFIAALGSYFSNIFCSSSFIVNCNSETLYILLISTIPLAFLRIYSLYELNIYNRGFILILSLSIIIFIFTSFHLVDNFYNLARNFLAYTVSLIFILKVILRSSVKYGLNNG